MEFNPDTYTLRAVTLNGFFTFSNGKLVRNQYGKPQLSENLIIKYSNYRVSFKITKNVSDDNLNKFIQHPQLISSDEMKKIIGDNNYTDEMIKDELIQDQILTEQNGKLGHGKESFLSLYELLDNCNDIELSSNSEKIGNGDASYNGIALTDYNTNQYWSFISLTSKALFITMGLTGIAYLIYTKSPQYGQGFGKYVSSFLSYIPRSRILANIF